MGNDGILTCDGAQHDPESVDGYVTHADSN